jgi:hypothetical protein
VVAADLVVPGQLRRGTLYLIVIVNGRLKLVGLLLPTGIAGERELLQ